MAIKTQAELQDAIDALMVPNTEGDVTVSLMKTLLKDQMESVDNRAWYYVCAASDLAQFKTGSVYNLPENNYVFCSNFDFGMDTISLISPDGCYTFQGACVGVTISYSGTSSFITTTQTNIILQLYNFFITTPSATCIDMANGNSLIVTLVVFFACKVAANLDSFAFLTLNDLPLIGCDEGFLANDTGTATLKLPQMNGNADVGGNFITLSGAASQRCIMSTIDARPESTEFFMEVTGDYGGDISITGGVLDLVTGGGFFKGSRNQTDIKILIEGVRNVPSSKVIAFGEVNGNSTATTVASDAYLPINVPGLLASVVTERFVLTDPATGLWTYVGLEPISGVLDAIIFVVKTGSTRIYRFAISVNGAVPVFATASYSPVEVKTTQVHTAVSEPISLVTGDTVQVKQAGVGTSDSLTITDIKMQING